MLQNLLRTLSVTDPKLAADWRRRMGLDRVPEKEFFPEASNAESSEEILDLVRSVAGEARPLTPWRRWEQAAEALDGAEEAEDFQAIGMRCRECLIQLVQGAADVSMLQPGEEAPKPADFVHWSEIIARTIAHGSSAEEIRGYLCTLAKRLLGSS